MRALLALALFAAAPVAFAQELPGQADASRVPAGTYAVDTGHTQVDFTVNHFGFSQFTGQAGGATGSLTIDPAKPNDAKLDITIPTSGIVTTVAALDKHLASPDFFDAAKYPTIHFVSTKVVVSGTKAQITGDLTLHGVTKPVTLETSLVGAGTNPMMKKLNFGFEATTTISRSAFGMDKYVPFVSDEVKLHINAAFSAK
ncbi:YceI family protein [Sphingomonas trueperi]|jgi:polyisoprenoid-binding protein YceI|uniref:YceI family protein n=1 Tax=Sphingomonas trueperi TaxID=53317 RepID=UPI000EB054C9